MLKMLGYDITEDEYALLLHKYAWGLGRGINKDDLFETIPRLKKSKRGAIENMARSYAKTTRW